MLLIALSIFGIMSIISAVLLVSALMLSSKRNVEEPWEAFYHAQTQPEPIPVPVQRVEASS